MAYVYTQLQYVLQYGSIISTGIVTHSYSSLLFLCALDTYVLYDCKRTGGSHDTVITTVMVTQVTRETVSVLIVM